MAKPLLIASMIFLVVLFNNYVYLHDILWGKYIVGPTDQTGLPLGHYIGIGTKSTIAITVSNRSRRARTTVLVETREQRLARRASAAVA